MSERFQYSFNEQGVGMSVGEKFMSMRRYLPMIAIGLSSAGALAIQFPDTISWLGVGRNALISAALTHEIIDIGYFNGIKKGSPGRTLTALISLGSGIATGIISAQYGVGPGMLLPVGEGMALLGLMSQSIVMRLQSPRD